MNRSDRLVVALLVVAKISLAVALTAGHRPAHEGKTPQPTYGPVRPGAPSVPA